MWPDGLADAVGAYGAGSRHQRGAAPWSPPTWAGTSGMVVCQSSFQIRWSAPEAAHATSAVNAALPSVTVPPLWLVGTRHDRRTGTRSLTARHVVTVLTLPKHKLFTFLVTF